MVGFQVVQTVVALVVWVLAWSVTTAPSWVAA